MKRILCFLLIAGLLIPAAGCSRNLSENEAAAVNGQKEAAKVERYESVMPANFKWFDYRKAALSFDRLLMEQKSTGTYPLIWEDNTSQVTAFDAYIGDGRYGADGTEEAVAVIASVLSGSLLKIDKSSQNGVNRVAQLHAFFSENEKVILNNPGASSKGASMWYMLYPAILFGQVSMRYPEEAQIRQDMLATVESWYRAYEIMASKGGFDYTGFDFTDMTPYDNGIWKEPDCAAGIAVLLYNGYELTQKEEYLEAVKKCLSYLERYPGSPLYEILLYYAPAMAAKLNAEYGTDYHVAGFLDSVLNGGSIPRGGWGSLNGTWGDYPVNGLMGSTTDGGGYAFSMNTFGAGYAFASLAKYDTRYARAMGIWYLNAAANSRYFFAGQVAKENQSAPLNEKAAAIVDEAGSAVPYEGIRKSFNGQTPWAGGDPTVYGWGDTDFSLYSGAHTGMFAAVVVPTDAEGILKINCNAAEPLCEGYKTYLLYNPYEQVKNISYTLPDGKWDLFDGVSKGYMQKEAAGAVSLSLPPDAAAVVVEIPAGTPLVHENDAYFAGEKQVAQDTVTVSINGMENNETVSGRVTLPVSVFSTGRDTEIGEILLSVDGQEFVFEDAGKVVLNTKNFSAGSKTLTVKVRMTNQKTDSTAIRLQFQ